MSDSFQEGDFVWFEYHGEDIYGTIMRGPLPIGNWKDYYVVKLYDGLEYNVHASCMKFITRTQATDIGAEQYEEVMFLQDKLSELE